VLLPVAHRLVGSLMLGAAVVLVVRTSTAMTDAFAPKASGTGLELPAQNR
jgi:hypothetical protein